MIYAENILICITVPLAVTAAFVRGDARRFMLSSLAGMVLCLLSAYITGYITSLGSLPQDEISIYISPVVEEIIKLLPLLFILYVFRPKDETIFLCAVALGAGFATFENCCYILTAGAESLTYTLIRGLAVGVMHVVSVLALAFGLVIIRRSRLVTLAGVMGALSLSTTFHALYNLLVSGHGAFPYIGYALPLAAAVVLYFSFRRLTGEARKTE
ncbi:MAG: PrsW family intramembrane metalloprotease [Oscillospiraceae bacterium]|nr:PrsW family intramembrane metalloprotease [Oscillospiraceae bacterium]